MPHHFVLSLAERVATGRDPGSGGVILQAPERQLGLRAPGPGLAAVLTALAGEGAAPEQLAALAQSAGEPEEMAEVYFLLGRLEQAGFLRYSVAADGKTLAAAEPLTPAFRLAAVPPGTTLAGLSRFAFLRRRGEEMVLESPRSLARVILPDPRAAAAAAALGAPGDAAALARAVPALPEGAAAALLALAAGTGMVSPLGPGGEPEEEADPALAYWEFHDLLFHARSRMGRRDGPYGGTYRFRGRTEPLPAVKPPMAAAVRLDRPDLARLAQADVPFSRVLEDRRSVRDQGDDPLTGVELGHFLFRVARLRERLPRQLQEVCRKPYPSGGAIHELELYLVVRACTGIAPGLYHYEPEQHALELLSEINEATGELLQDARRATGGKCLPQVLILLASRFPRLAWKYEAMAYAATLKHVGVLYQTMYLVATAMGLAPCGLGGGNSDCFARATGLNYFAETTVGEFALGSRRPTAASDPGAEGPGSAGPNA